MTTNKQSPDDTIQVYLGAQGFLLVIVFITYILFLR